MNGLREETSCGFGANRSSKSEYGGKKIHKVVGDREELKEERRSGAALGARADARFENGLHVGAESLAKRAGIRVQQRRMRDRGRAQKRAAHYFRVPDKSLCRRAAAT